VIRALSDEEYAVFAPPLGRLIDPAADLDAVVVEYSGGAAAGPPSAPPVPPKRKWKFW
jgi:hypothetical protein